MRFLSLHLTLTQGISKRAWTKTSEVGLVKPAHAHTSTRLTIITISISKCQGGPKSQLLPHCLAVAVRPEQSPMELHLHVFTEWATRVHRVQSETLRPPSTFETLKRMQLAEFGTSFKYAGRCSSSTKLLQIFIGQNGKTHHPPTSTRHDARCTWCRTAADLVRYPIHSSPFCKAEVLFSLEWNVS